MHPIIFQWSVWGKTLTVSSYGLMLAIAFFVGLAIAKKIGKKFSVQEEEIEKLAFWMIVCGIIGARFLFTFVEHSDEYLKNPLQFFAFQKGGLSFYGGFIFAIGFTLFYCWKRKLSFWNIADIYSPSVALGLAIAKIGCFLAGCCHGKTCTLPWGMSFTNPQSHARPLGVPLHPTQLYESITALVIFIFLYILIQKRKFEGQIFALLLISYCVVRSYLEIYRGNPGHMGTLTTAQFLSIPIVVFAIGVYFIRNKTSKR